MDALTFLNKVLRSVLLDIGRVRIYTQVHLSQSLAISLHLGSLEDLFLRWSGVTPLVLAYTQKCPSVGLCVRLALSHLLAHSAGN